MMMSVLKMVIFQCVARWNDQEAQASRCCRHGCFVCAPHVWSNHDKYPEQMKFDHVLPIYIHMPLGFSHISPYFTSVSQNVFPCFTMCCHVLPLGFSQCTTGAWHFPATFFWSRRRRDLKPRLRAVILEALSGKALGSPGEPWSLEGWESHGKKNHSWHNYMEIVGIPSELVGKP